MQGSVNNWEKTGKVRSIKGVRRPKNELNPTGHVEPGSKNFDGDGSDSMGFLKVITHKLVGAASKVKSNWRVVVSSFGEAQIRAGKKRSKKNKNR
jgi:hypothetical protein